MKKCRCYLLTLLLFFPSFVVSAEQVLIFAASSMASALSQLIEQYKKETGKDIQVSYGASSTLARQLSHGAPADIFISANEKWMNYVIENKSVNSLSVSPWLSNSLVLIAHNATILPNVLKKEDIVRYIDDSRLAIAHPAHVPAGIYSKKALQSLGIWNDLQDKLAFSNSARATLALVERQEAQLGIVYLSDALASNKVKIISNIPAKSHDNIIFPIARTHSTNLAADEFFKYLNSNYAHNILLKNGFSPLAKDQTINAINAS